MHRGREHQRNREAAKRNDKHDRHGPHDRHQHGDERQHDQMPDSRGDPDRRWPPNGRCHRRLRLGRTKVIQGQIAPRSVCGTRRQALLREVAVVFQVSLMELVQGTVVGAVGECQGLVGSDRADIAMAAPCCTAVAHVIRLPQRFRGLIALTRKAGRHTIPA